MRGANQSPISPFTKNKMNFMNNMSVNQNKTINVGGWITGLAVAALFLHPETSAAQAPVNLLSTSRFAILAATEITDVPASAITGDVGLSPAARSYITGLTAPEVTGSIFAASDGGAVAVLLTQAQSDLTTAYNDAAGRMPAPVNAYLNPGGGNIGGMNLGPGLYGFTGAALISGSDLTLTGSATNVWIFQIASTLTVDNGIHVILAGGAQAANIFWQVGSSAMFGTTTVFQGTIMAQDEITFATGATLDGRALSKTAVTLQSTTITVPTLLPSPPIFVSIARADGAVTLVIDVTPNFALTLQTSTNLMKWTTLATPTPTASPFTYVDSTHSTIPVLFYRAFYP
jgi:hypothetical protein